MVSCWIFVVDNIRLKFFFNVCLILIFIREFKLRLLRLVFILMEFIFFIFEMNLKKKLNYNYIRV